MKPLILSAVVLGVTTAVIGWADRTAADEPFQLNQAQLDRITAGNGDDRNLETVALNFDKSPPPQHGDTWEFSLRVDSPGTGSGPMFSHVVIFEDD